MRNDLVATICSLAAGQHGAVGALQLRQLGVSARAERRAVDAGWLRPARPGVLALTSTPPTWRQRLQAGLLTLEGRGWVSHDAAAHLHDLHGSVDTVEFTVARDDRGRVGRRAVHTTGLVVPGDVITVDGLACSSVERTLLDLATLGIPFHRLRSILVDAVRSRRTDVDALSARLTTLRGQGRPGVRQVQRLLAELATEVPAGGAVGRTGR